MRSLAGLPNRNEFSRAIGRAPIARMSRTIPPTPVAAPCTGSTADGWLCDSILNAIAKPSPMSMTPAFSAPGATSRRSLVLGRVLSKAFVCLYPQCSLHIEPKSPSSNGFGSRPSLSHIAAYSARDSATSRRAWSETGDMGILNCVTLCEGLRRRGHAARLSAKPRCHRYRR